jgi:hypothetical protein
VFRWLILVFAGALKPRARLIAENVCLRQQLVVLKRRQRRPNVRDADRRFWVLASRWFDCWRETLLIVQPETVLRWHRKGWKTYWRWLSRRRQRGGRRRVSLDLRELIRRMARENRLWGPTAHSGRARRAWLHCLCPDRREIHAKAVERTSFASLAAVPGSICRRHLGLRFVDCANGLVSHTLRILCHSSWVTGNYPRSRDGQSHCRMACATACTGLRCR